MRHAGGVSHEIRYQDPEREHLFELRVTERFSRIEFALRVLDLLRPDMTVTVHEGLHRIRVRRGRDWSQGGDVDWASIAIPATAGRHNIAFALAELAGKAEDAFVVDLVARASAYRLAS